MCAIPVCNDATDVALGGSIRQEVLPLSAARRVGGVQGALALSTVVFPARPPSTISSKPPLCITFCSSPPSRINNPQNTTAMCISCSQSMASQIIGRDVKASAGMRVRLSNAGKQYIKIYDAKHGLVGCKAKALSLLSFSLGSHYPNHAAPAPLFKLW